VKFSVFWRIRLNGGISSLRRWFCDIYPGESFSVFFS
jgi:hypothetical protein